jgi:hypothetical protein
MVSQFSQAVARQFQTQTPSPWRFRMEMPGREQVFASMSILHQSSQQEEITKKPIDFQSPFEEKVLYFFRPPPSSTKTP